MTSQLYAEKLYTAKIDIATSGNNVIIVAPGVGHHLAIDFLQVFTPVAVGVTFEYGPTGGPYVAFNGKYSFASGQNITSENSYCNPDGVLIFKDNQVFVINLDASQQCSGIVNYRIIGE
jgi:hypothetical protein